MLNRFSRLLLVATSLSPILGAIAINKIADGQCWIAWVPWVAAAAGLALICLLLLHHVAHHAQVERVEVRNFEGSDTEVLAFLLTYLLPFISSENMNFDGRWLSGAYILLIVFVVVSHAGALHFNPVMGLLGYHFYKIKDSEGLSAVLVSRIDFSRIPQDVEAVRLARNVYLQKVSLSRDA